MLANPPAPRLPADLNGNGTVDFPDFLLLSDMFGDTVDPPGSGADINGNGAVDFPDFLELSNTFGQSVGASAAAVPEPAGVVLLGLGGLLLACRRRSRG